MTESNGALNGGAADNTSGAPIADQAKQVANDLQEQVSAVAEAVTEAAKQEAAEIGAAAKQALSGATDRISSAVYEQKTAGADYVDKVARAIERAADEFEADVPQAAKYIRRAGAQLGDLATTVRERDMRELVNEVEGLARRQPALFFGGAMIAGFAAVRFIKSSPPNAAEAKAPTE